MSRDRRHSRPLPEAVPASACPVSITLRAVYCLFDGAGPRCSIGRTDHLHSRLKADAKVKSFASWQATVTPDCASMLRLELELIRMYRPCLSVAGLR